MGRSHLAQFVSCDPALLNTAAVITAQLSTAPESPRISSDQQTTSLSLFSNMCLTQSLSLNVKKFSTKANTLIIVVFI